MIVTTLRLEDDLHAALVKAASQQGRSAHSLVVHILKTWIEPPSRGEPTVRELAALPTKTLPPRAAGPAKSCPHHIGAGGRCGKCPDGVAS